MAAKEPPPPLRIEIVATGDEILRGRSRDTNFGTLASRVADAGHEIVGGRTVGDDLEALAGAFRDAAARADVVIVTGGLGPTPDDLTRDAAARVLGVPLEEHAYSRRMILSGYARRDLDVPEAAFRQSLIPRGAEFLHNDVGSAPGFRFRLGRAAVFCLPGPPREMESMFERKVLPALHSGRAGPPRSRYRHLSCCGASEASIAERISEFMVRGRPVSVGTAAGGGVVTVSIRGSGKAAPMVAPVEREIRARLGPDVYASGRVPPGENLARLLEDRGLTLAVAESCTAGLVQARLTDRPGASRVLVGGVVAYANSVKETVLGVRRTLLARKGAVSRSVAEAMATGVRRLTGADLGLAVTGIAGPGGGRGPLRPVGLVWFAVADRRRVRAYERRFAGDRTFIRSIAAHYGIDLVRRYVEKGDPGA